MLSELAKYYDICIFLLLNIIQTVTTLPPVVHVGALFSEQQSPNSPTELAFKYAVHSINRDKGILADTTLTYDIQYVGQGDSFHACKKVCEQIKTGVHAIFGPFDSYLGAHIHSICDALDIPHLETRLDVEMSKKEFSINLHPTQYYVNRAFLDVIHYLNWTKVGILFEKDYGIIQLRELVRIPNLEVHVRQVNPSSYASVLLELKHKEVHNLIIDTNAANISIVLKSILQLQMNEYKYHYLFTSFDIETFDLEDFKYNFVNITSFRLVDVDDVGVKEILKDMEAFNNAAIERQNSASMAANVDDLSHNYRKLRIIETEPALIYDSVYIFAIGLQTLEQSHTLHSSNVTCDEENPWDGGLSLINYINSVEWKGLSGPIQFKEGRRIQFKLDLVKLKQHSIVKVGEWSPHTGLNITDSSLFFDAGSMNVTLVVITILETPYVMMHYGKNFTGNERFFGFCVDILELVAHDVGFDYILDLVPDRKYGAKDPITGEWNGMVAQLMAYKADLAVGSMTITYARESVIDFTKPFMNLGISILFKVPSSPPSRLFSFMNPLAFEIWIYVLAAYFLVSLTIYTVAKLSPFEWDNGILHPHCNLKPPLISQGNKSSTNSNNYFSLANSFWFTIGTLMQQGSDVSPRAASTRIVSSIWWFFTLIIIASYTANLAAFLTVERMITPIENAEDLASQAEISYGTLESGSTMTFFRDSMIETYRKMWRSMDNKKPSSFTSTYEEGIKRVNVGNYAFLMESTMLDYIVQRDCNLTQVGGLLDTKGYGIATPKGSPWRDKISLAILELQEKGDIQMLYDKWWKSTGDTCIRKHNNKQSKANALGLDNIGGVFVVLLVGIAVAICVAVIEFWQHYQKQGTSENHFSYLTPPQTMSADMQYVYCKGHNNVDGGKSDMMLLQNEQHEQHEQLQLQAEQQYLQQQQQYYNATQNCTQTPMQRSLWTEMFDEFRYALHCMDAQQRPALKRRCPKCHVYKNVDEFVVAAATTTTTTTTITTAAATTTTTTTTTAPANSPTQPQYYAPHYHYYQQQQHLHPQHQHQPQQHLYHHPCHYQHNEHQQQHQQQHQQHQQKHMLLSSKNLNAGYNTGYYGSFNTCHSTSQLTVCPADTTTTITTTTQSRPTLLPSHSIASADNL